MCWVRSRINIAESKRPGPTLDQNSTHLRGMWSLQGYHVTTLFSYRMWWLAPHEGRGGGSLLKGGHLPFSLLIHPSTLSLHPHSPSLLYHPHTHPASLISHYTSSHTLSPPYHLPSCKRPHIPSYWGQHHTPTRILCTWNAWK